MPATPMDKDCASILVDGVPRPAQNSNGGLIHWSEEGVRNFWRWFGDSKSIDRQGRPLVVYRGESCGIDFDVFDRNKVNANAFFFTPVKEVATIYAKGREPRDFFLRADNLFDVRDPRHEAFIREWATNYDSWVDRGSGEEVDPYDVVMSGRLFDYEGDWSVSRWQNLHLSIEASGFDGAVLMDWDNDLGTIEVFVAYAPEQIKLASRNAGIFDHQSASVSDDDALQRLAVAPDFSQLSVSRPIHDCAGVAQHYRLQG